MAVKDLIEKKEIKLTYSAVGLKEKVETKKNQHDKISEMMFSQQEFSNFLHASPPSGTEGNCKRIYDSPRSSACSAPSIKEGHSRELWMDNYSNSI